MSAGLRRALDRTLLLMRDDVGEGARDESLLAALTGTEIALVGDAGILAHHSAQSAYVTAALLMARSGHRVHLVAPDVPLVGPQPPLKPGGLISSLNEIGRDLLPGVEFAIGHPDRGVDLEVRFGDGPSAVRAQRTVSVGAERWSARLWSPGPVPRWSKSGWPFGGMAGGALAAGEAFKTAMRKLRAFARNPDLFDAQFAPTDAVEFELAPPSAPRSADVGRFDLVSAGAIANGALFALSRITGVVGDTRVIDDDGGDLSNLNRNMLLLRSMVEGPKASALAALDLGGLRIEPVPLRYGPESVGALGPLAPRVLVGADHIPTRWEVQKAKPGWLGIGATTHWSAMASFHSEGLGCAGCLHPRDDPTDRPIPTVAFVSFWAGLILAVYFARAAAGEALPVSSQQAFLTPLRPEVPWRSPVAMLPDCPVEAHPIATHPVT